MLSLAPVCGGVGCLWAQGCEWLDCLRSGACGLYDDVVATCSDSHDLDRLVTGFSAPIRRR